MKATELQQHKAYLGARMRLLNLARDGMEGIVKDPARSQSCAVRAASCRQRRIWSRRRSAVSSRGRASKIQRKREDCIAKAQARLHRACSERNRLRSPHHGPLVSTHSGSSRLSALGYRNSPGPQMPVRGRPLWDRIDEKLADAVPAKRVPDSQRSVLELVGQRTVPVVFAEPLPRARRPSFSWLAQNRDPDPPVIAPHRS